MREREEREREKRLHLKKEVSQVNVLTSVMKHGVRKTIVVDQTYGSRSSSNRFSLCYIKASACDYSIRHFITQYYRCV